MGYDYLVVGAGLFGAVFAQQAKATGKSVLVIDRRSHVGGNVYTEEIEDRLVNIDDQRLFVVAEALRRGFSPQKINHITGGELPRGAVLPALQHVYLQ